MPGGLAPPGGLARPSVARPGGLALIGAALLAVALLASGCAAGTVPGPEGSPGRATGPAGTPSAAASPGAADGSPAAAGGRPAVRPRRQLITVTAASYGVTYATLNAYQSTGHGWRRVFGPWTARIGRNGFAPPGAKREGDGRTPTGAYRMAFLFGVLPNPGVRLPYRRIHAYDYWDDDPASPRYNEWVDARRASAGASPEPMDVSAYDYGAVIGYNTARTPGLGSAIFLHLNIGTGTAGCVTLPPDKLLPLLRWLNPARSPRIRMGVR
jgi:L,D-peptidoglycan transpeptidase YkuD (ErfK/YbiS/YcfS/YnhG family)